MLNWTAANFQTFARSLNPYPHQGTIRFGSALPGTSRPWNPGQYLDASDYSAREINTSFRDFANYVGSWDLRTVLSHDYRDDRGQYRQMTQLGGHRSSNWVRNKGVSVTYRSDTHGDGRGSQYYNLVMGNEGYDNAEFIAWRNRTGTAMASQGSRFGTGATFFMDVANNITRQIQLHPHASLHDISARLFAAVHQVHPTQTYRVGRRYVSSHPSVPGTVEIAPLGLRTQNDMLLGIFNNVRNHSGFWGQSYFRHGVVPPTQIGIQYFIKPAGPNGNGDLVKMERAGLNIHQRVYGTANAIIAEATGIGQ